MTKHLIMIGNDIRARLLAGGAPQHMEPVLRDAWASLFRWHQAGGNVYRLREVRECPQDLAINGKPRNRSCCVQLPNRTEWIVLARHEPGEVIGLNPGTDPWAYPDTTLTWCCDLDGRGLESGAINIDRYTRWREVWLMPGETVDLEQHAAPRALHSDDLAGAERRLALALPYWLGGLHDR